MSYSVGDLVRDYAAGRRDFQEIELPQADLQGIHLAGADLRYADLSGANLSKADLRGCLLFGSNFRGALLEGALLDHADYDAYTHFPAGFDPKAHRLHNLSAEASQ